ncbi:glycoside hydrolase family 13 protein [Microbacterium sp. RU33B]|uniref:glycoside hydrolase family 13 protein n=1 Tax=Microbacterium sp. RU33B TaxID=1907390 RepID=UPI0009682AC3|nr:glycoside hydrolase family 13 protein [Microbacterium sp. RU33B]SIT68103.1 alpha-glucosidase [Microbacterium sp. RU33B]
MTILQPHHDGSPLYVSHDAPDLGDEVTVRLRVPVGYGPLARVLVRSNPDHEPLWVEASADGEVDGWEWWSARIVVANPRHGYRWHLVHEDDRVEILSQGGLSDIDALDAVDFALVAGNPPPSWTGDVVMYQIFPDRFARSAAADDRPIPDWAIPAEWGDDLDPVPPGRGQQFFGGDLDGIVEHLDHIEALGVTMIYHTPIFPAESNHRYDASTFLEVDPLLGGDAAYLRLIEAARARGIRIMGDLTSNHSGSAHEWFRAAHRHPGAPESEFYYFLDDDNEDYVSWLGAPTLPKFDWSSTELRRRFVEGPDSVVAKWLSEPYRIDGWRIDVANMTGRLGDTDLNESVRRAIRRTMIDIEPETLLLAESTNDAASDLQGDAWHGAMTYPAFTRGLWAWLSAPTGIPHVNAFGVETDEMWYFGVPTGMPAYDARQFAAQMQRFTSQLPWRVRLGSMLPLDTHDTARFATRALPGTIPVAVGLSMTLPGIPVVFAGDEFGLTGVDGEMSRTPIPWDRIDEPEVAERIALYRELIGMRRSHPVLGTGGLRWLHIGAEGVVFVRESAEETLLVLAARDDLDVELPATVLAGAAAATPLHGEATLATAEDGSVLLSADGPAFAVWALPGVAAPEPTASSESALPQAGGIADAEIAALETEH